MNALTILKAQAMSYYMLYLSTGYNHYLLLACDLACYYRCKKMRSTAVTATFILTIAA